MAGSFIGVRFDRDTVNKLNKFIEDNNIPHAIKEEHLHTTLLYSNETISDIDSFGAIHPPLIGKVTKLEKWLTRGIGDMSATPCLVIRFECDELLKRHNELHAKFNTTYDFDIYNPHITLTYNCEGVSVASLPDILDYLTEIVIVEECHELDYSLSNII